MDAHPNAGDRHAETASDLAVGLPFELSGEEQLPVERGEGRQGFPQEVRVEVPFLLRASGPRGLHERDFRAAAANQVDRRAQRDDSHPGGKGGLVAVARKRAEGPQKSLLRGVLGQRRVPCDAAGRRQSGRGCQACEGGKGVLVPSARSLDQGRLVGGGRRDRAKNRGCRGAGGWNSNQEPLPRKASKDLTAESARLRIRSRNFWICARCSSVKIGWISVRIFAKSTAPSA